MALFTVGEICEVTGARIISGDGGGRLSARIRRICTDSRQVRRGDMFVALVGERFDGHKFASQALRRGAIGAIIQDSVTTMPAGGRTRARRAAGSWLLGVPDTLRAYQDLAAYHRRRFRYPVVAVTGSNGKTTTKDMVAGVLAERLTVLKTEGNLNNRIGVPQTLLRLTARHQAAVVEMGVDQRGQTMRLCEIAQPTIGIITNIGADHLELFGSLEASVEAKAELVESVGPNGTLVLNADDDHFERLAARAGGPVVSFGLSPNAQVRAVGVEAASHRGQAFRLVLPGRTRHPRVALRVHGIHNLRNALAASAVGHVFRFSGIAIAQGLHRFRPASMRSEVLVRDRVRIVNDAYNANPSSMRAAIDMLVELGLGKRTIAVLGDMRELGSEAESMHRDVGRYLVSRGVSRLIAAGPLGQRIADGARGSGMAEELIVATDDASLAAEAATRVVRPGDVVLVKGSRAMRMERVTEALCEALA